MLHEPFLNHIRNIADCSRKQQGQKRDNIKPNYYSLTIKLIILKNGTCRHAYKSRHSNKDPTHT